jgi:hypothetical protein
VALQQIVDQNEQKAKAIRDQEDIRNDKLLAMKEEERQEAAALQKEEDRAAAALQQEEDRVAEEHRETQRQKDEVIAEEEKQRTLGEDAVRKEEDDKVRKKKVQEQKEREHVLRAQKLVGQLQQIRASVAPFDSSKVQPVPKRRLQYKKLAKGKLNTLNHDAGKIQAVANELVQAIAQARADDEQLKQQMQAQPQQIPPEVARGKRYLLDLLTSNVVSRVQSEQFNGIRGDGFPYAAVITLVASQEKEISSMMSAHIFMACPLSIPNLPDEAASAESSDENALMEGLGMKRDAKTGEFETFDSYLHRTEGLISMGAALMCSAPDNHSVMGGFMGGIKWLYRFIATLPKPPSYPLPIHTAPVLSSFLTVAGHMMARKSPDEFRKLVTHVEEKVITRLDEGSIGAPSATRLKKLMEGGFDKFHAELPQGAIAELYVGSDACGGGGGLGGGIQPASSSAFGHQTSYAGSVQTVSSAIGNAPTPVASPFAPSHPSTATAPSPFAPVSGAPSSFAAPPAFSAAGPAPSPFTSGTTVTTGASPFGVPGGGSPAPSPFGQPSGGAPAPSPFGAHGGGAPAPSPFGQPAGGAPAPSPFGQPAGGAPVPSPFGQPAGGPPTPSPFGQPAGGGGAMTPATNSFAQSGAFPVNTSFAPAPRQFTSSNTGAAGGGGGKKNAPPCKFYSQGRCKQGDFCKFSHEDGGGGGGSGSNAPFNNSAGGGSSNAGGHGNKQPCTFFAQGKCRNGANCRFSHDTGGGAGQQQQQSNAFGGGGQQQQQSNAFDGGAGQQHQQSNAFGGGGGGTPGFGSPFAQNSNQATPSPFGGPASSPSPFGQPATNNANPSPFGQPSAANASPFGQPSNPW